MRFFYSLILLCSFQISFAQNFDVNTLKKINVNRNTELDGTMKLISNTEYIIGIGTPIATCAFALLDKNGKLLQKGIDMSLAMIANTGATFILKRIINRERPVQTYPFIQALENERYHSFPSGHTSNAFVLATSLSLNFKKWYVIVPSYAWAATVGYSRMHMGVHYPSDVLGGAIVGAGSAIVTYKANQYLHRYYQKKYVAKDL